MTSLLLRHPIKIFEFKVKWGQKIGVWLRVFSGKLIQNRWNGRFWNFGAWLRLVRGKLIQNHNFWEFLKMSKIGVWLRLFSGKLIQTFFSTFFKFYYKLRQKKPPKTFQRLWRKNNKWRNINIEYGHENHSKQDWQICFAWLVQQASPHRSQNFQSETFVWVTIQFWLITG